MMHSETVMPSKVKHQAQVFPSRDPSRLIGQLVGKKVAGASKVVLGLG